jgi:micrococcal nuclease
MKSQLARTRTVQFMGVTALVGTLFATLTGCTPAGSASPGTTAPDNGTPTATQSPDGPEQLRGKLSEVLDGDTIKITPVDDSGKSTGKPDITVRMLGIDAPEIAHGSDAPQCGGNEAKAELERISVGDDYIIVTYDPKADRTDRFERTLGYVSKQEGIGPNGPVAGMDLGGAMVQNGFAEAWYPQNEPEPKKFASYTKNAQIAKDQKKGSWATCDTQGR